MKCRYCGKTIKWFCLSWVHKSFEDSELCPAAAPQPIFVINRKRRLGEKENDITRAVAEEDRHLLRLIGVKK